MTSTDHPGPGSTPGDDVVAVLAVKRLDEAKTRLAASHGAGPGPLHRALVLAMMRDTVDAVAAAGIERIVVISPDEDVLAAAHAAGAVGLRESTGRDVPGGHARLNLAFAHATTTVREWWPGTRAVLLVQADLPAATAESLRAVVACAAEHRRAVLTDRDGTGTTILIRDVDITELPLFGPDSASAHRMAGAVELDPTHARWPDLRTDVDTAADLETARSLGLGRHTTDALRRQGTVTDAATTAGRCR
ncbi:2-phospho-L-lactate guanylyltransferase [Gordonia insulae]|nr:2-phospho-L-lactate guanylyltransferase [Gordonia insulae]